MHTAKSSRKDERDLPRTHIMKKILAILTAALLLALLGSSALAAGTGAVSGPPVLTLTLQTLPGGGSILAGVTAARSSAFPVFMLEPLTRAALTDDALISDPATGMPMPAEAPVGTGVLARWSEGDAEGLQAAPFVVRGDVLGTGTLSIAQLTRMAAHLNGDLPLEGVFLLAADVTGTPTGTPDIADLVWEAAALNAEPAVGADAAAEIVQAAADWQTYGDTYKADIYHVTQLHAGERILGMLPGQSAFYTNGDTLEAAGGSYVAMYGLLQMVPHPEFGYRTQVGVYEVNEDMWVATGYCLANSIVEGQWTGAGGGVQYVLPDYEGQLTLVETIDLEA